MAADVKAFLKGKVAREFPELAVRGRLLYHPPVGHLLRGYWAETSAFTRGQFFITSFAQVMAVPAVSPVLSFGKRVSDGQDLVWSLDSRNEAMVARSVVERLRNEERTFFERLRSLDDFVAINAPPDREPVDIRVAEALFYALVLIGRDDEAVKIVGRIRVSEDPPQWERDVQNRLIRDANDLSSDRVSMLDRISNQERETRRALGISAR